MKPSPCRRHLRRCQPRASVPKGTVSHRISHSYTSTRTKVSCRLPVSPRPAAHPGDVELIPLTTSPKYNQQRLMHRLGRVPPAEAEAHYNSQHVTGHPAGPQNPEGA